MIFKTTNKEWNRMRKKLVFAMAVVLLVALTPSILGAEEAEVKELTLAESIAIDLENNLDLKKAAYDVALSEAEYEETKLNNLLRTSIVALKSAELKLKRAQDSLDERKKALALEEIARWYFEVVKSKKRVEIEKISLQQSKENLEMVRNKLSLGDASQLEMMQAETSVASAELSLVQAENDLHLAKMNFNQALGFPLEAESKLTDAFSLEPLEMTFEDSVEIALVNRYEITQAQDTLELTRLKLDLAQNQYTPELEKKKTEIELNTAKLQLEQIKAGIVLEITRSFLELKEKEASVEITAKKEEEKEESYRIAQEQYRAGLIATQDLLDSQIQFTQAKINALEALFSHNLAKKQFVKGLGEDLQETQEITPSA
jgi:outer membrane protein TolC